MMKSAIGFPQQPLWTWNSQGIPAFPSTLSINFLSYHCPIFPCSLGRIPFLPFHHLYYLVCPLPPYLDGSKGSCTCLIAAVLAIKGVIQDFGTGVHRIHEDRYMLVDLTQVSKSVIKQGQIDKSVFLKDFCPGVLVRARLRIESPGYRKWHLLLFLFFFFLGSHLCQKCLYSRYSTFSILSQLQGLQDSGRPEYRRADDSRNSKALLIFKGRDKHSQSCWVWENKKK